MSKVYRHSDGSYRDYPELNHMISSNPLTIQPGINYDVVIPNAKIETKHVLDPRHLEEMYDAYYTKKEVEEGETLLQEKKGLKYDSQKVPLDLIPYDALVEIGKVLQAGELKYGTANWANGIEIRRLLAAAMRHLGQFNNGEDYDEETQTLHIANAATNLMFAIWMFKNRPDLDNRWAKKDKK